MTLISGVINSVTVHLLQLPEVVLIKDEDSDSNDTFEDGEWKQHTQPELLNLWLRASDRVTGYEMS